MTEGHDLFGRVVCAIGDMDRDGHADFAVGDWKYRSDEGQGAVWVVSGKTGEPLDMLSAHVPRTLFGDLMQSCDVDGDGGLDLVIASRRLEDGGTDLIEVYEVGTKETIVSISSPTARSFAPAGDADGDGLRDILVRQRSPASVVLLSGKSGEVLARHQPTAGGPAPGTGMLAHADLDGDGIRDVLVASAASGDGEITAGIVVCSGKDLHVLTTWKEMRPETDNARLVAVGDLNADGVTDVALAAQRGSIPVHSGADGSLLFRTMQRFESRHSLGAIGDCNGDGTADLVVGDIDAQILGQVFLISGRDGSTLRTIDPEPKELTYDGSIFFGTSVAGLGDVDGDGVDDLAVGIGHPWESAYPGEVALYSGATGAMLLHVVEEDLLR